MDDHTTKPIFRINDADIGTVVFVVEGIKEEYRILEQIFVEVLGYVRQGCRVKDPSFLELRSKRNQNNRVIIMRSSSSSVKSVAEFNDYFDKTYVEFFMERNISIRYSPIYYIWDRDPGSNSEGQMQLAMEMMNTSRNSSNNMNGLLLVSYPCIEAYLISCNDDLAFLPFGVKPKQYVGSHRLSHRNLDSEKIVFGMNAMIDALLDLGIGFELADLDDYSDKNKMIFGREEAIRRNNRGEYRLLSLLSMALLDLEILVPVEAS